MVVVAAVAGACGGESATPDLSGPAARGDELVTSLGCAGCHRGAEVGPSWTGTWGADVELSDGTRVRFDAAYVRSAVRTPDLHRRSGDWVRMPAYGLDQLSDDELDDIVAYLRALQ